MACSACGTAWSAAMRTSRPEQHSLVGAYALDALAGSDLLRFERHLARCARCSRELSALREAAACLAAGPAAEPPPGLTERAVAVLGVAASTAAHRLGEQESRAHAIGAVLAAPDATVLRARGTTGGSATIVMSARRHALIFTATRLPRVPSSERYELWLMGPSGDRPAGMLPGARHGMTGPVIASGPGPGVPAAP